jgi:hypothetical protein
VADLYAAETAPYQSAKFALRDERRRLELLRVQLETERSSHLSDWRDCGDHYAPYRARFNLTDANRGGRKDQKIIDSTPRLAHRDARSGMSSGITSPARPWFHLITGDDTLDENPMVKDWCYAASERMAKMFLRSDLYTALPIVYGDLLAFGTSAMLVEEDMETTLRFTVLPIGSYCIANDKKGRVRTFYRTLRMTVRQVVDTFCPPDPNTGERDFTNVSIAVTALWENGNTEAWVDISHFILANDDYDPRNLHARYKKYRSIYYERGTQSNSATNYITPDDEGKFLRLSGYDWFPVLVARWEVTGEDAWASDWPGLTALGDARQLQRGEKKGNNAIDKMADPPLQAPTSMKTQKVSLISGDITYFDETSDKKGIKPLHEVNFRITELEQKQEQVRNRLKRAFFVDLFLMISEDERQQPATATEIAEKKEEKLVALGPMLSMFNQNFLSMLINISGKVMAERDELPPIPRVLKGRPLQIEFISILADALRAAGLASIERYAGFVKGIFEATQDPSDLDSTNRDKMIGVYGDRVSLPPGIVRSDDEIAALRQQRQQQQQQQQKAAQAEQMAGAAKDLASAKTGDQQPNALTDLINQSQAGQIAQ